MNTESTGIDQSAIKYVGRNYICKGIRALFTSEDKDLSLLTLFESGTWFYKIRLTTNLGDTTYLLNLEQEIVSKFDPTFLTELNPLTKHLTIFHSPTVYTDDIIFGSAVGSAIRKYEWTMDSVSRKEWATGCPDLYLSFHVDSWKEFMKFQHRFNYRKSSFTEKFLRELQLISDAGFLNEFIMEQHDWLMFRPENVIFRVEEFQEWKKENNISINLNDRFSGISLREK
jgi:hypothetical protein